MGTWGPGNFEDDDALDTLSFFQGEIEKTIESHLSGPRDALDGLMIQTVMAKVCIALALTDQCGAFVPERLGEWRKIVLGAFDERSVHLSQEFRAARRNVIMDTFDRFSALARR